MINRLFTILSFLVFTLMSMASTYQQTTAGMKFSWTLEDGVGVYTNKGTLIEHYAVSVHSSTNYVELESGWGIESNRLYYAYSPFDGNNKSFTAIPVSYTSQLQSVNAGTDHLSSVDYQMASFMTGTESASISFSHIGSIIHISWKVPVSSTFTSITLTSENADFITEATMNLQTQTVNQVTKSKSITLSLDNISLSKDDILDAYLAVLPVSIKGKTLTATLSCNDGKQYTTRINGTNMLAGNVYPILINNSVSDTNTSSSKSAAGLNFSTTSIASIEACSPDFLIDSDNTFNTGIKGDVNGDGKIDISDVSVLIKHCLRNTTNTLDKTICDITGDNNINSADIKALAYMCLQK